MTHAEEDQQAEGEPRPAATDQDDVGGHAVMIGGLWFAAPGNTHNPDDLWDRMRNRQDRSGLEPHAREPREPKP